MTPTVQNNRTSDCCEYENGELTDEQQARFLNGLERALNTAEFISDDVQPRCRSSGEPTCGWIIKRAPPEHGRQGSYEWRNFYDNQATLLS